MRETVWQRVRVPMFVGAGLSVAGLAARHLFGVPSGVISGVVLGSVLVYAAVATALEIRRAKPIKRTMEPGEFMRLYRARKIGWDLLDEYAEFWRRTLCPLPLFQYLGMTWQQWREWTGPKRRRPTGGNDGFVRLDDV